MVAQRGLDVEGKAVTMGGFAGSSGVRLRICAADPRDE